MAEKNIIDSEHFLEIPLSTQALYFHLKERAIDGYVDGIDSIKMKLKDVSDSDFDTLIDRKFILQYESGFVVITNARICSLINGMDIDVLISSANPSEAEMMEAFEKIYNSYPKKVGKTKGYSKYKAWVTTGRRVNGKNRKLTNSQIWDAIDRYKRRMEINDCELKYYKGFDTFMGDQILDYVDMEEGE